MNNSYAKHTPKIVVASALSAVLLIGAYVFLTTPRDEDPVAANTPGQTQATATNPTANTVPAEQTAASTTSVPEATPSTPVPAVATPTPSPQSTYKDGTYTKTIAYTVPKGGSNSLTLTATITNDSITSVSADNTYSDRESASYVNGFETSISGTVEGKPISSSFGSRIGGASLTTGAFLKAISQIKQDAL